MFSIIALCLVIRKLSAQYMIKNSCSLIILFNTLKALESYSFGIILQAISPEKSDNWMQNLLVLFVFPAFISKCSDIMLLLFFDVHGNQVILTKPLSL